MAKARDLKRRIRSVQNTRRITNTIQMVATAKLKRAQDRVVAARPYAVALTEVIGDLYSPTLAEEFALLRQPGAARRAALLLITSNRAQCGAYNGNLIRTARGRLAALKAEGTEVDLHVVGKKGIGYFRFMKVPMATRRTDIGDMPTPEHAAELVTPLMDAFGTGDLDRVEVVHGLFKSPLSTPPTVVRVLPVTPPEGKGPAADYIVNPSAREIVGELLPLYVRNQVFRALAESAAAENAARRVAMKNATDNADEMIETLERNYNRARQAQITQELAEIIGGAEALKG